MSSRRRDNFKLTFLAKNSGFIPLFLYKLLKFLFYKFKACLFIIGNKVVIADAKILILKQITTCQCLSS